MRDIIYGFTSTQVAVPTGSVTGVTIIPGINSAVIKYVSGGSLFIGGPGVTLTNGYIFASGESVNANLSGTFYLTANGSTAVAHILFGLSEGSI